MPPSVSIRRSKYDSGFILRTVDRGLRISVCLAILAAIIYVASVWFRAPLEPSNRVIAGRESTVIDVEFEKLLEGKWTVAGLPFSLSRRAVSELPADDWKTTFDAKAASTPMPDEFMTLEPTLGFVRREIKGHPGVCELAGQFGPVRVQIIVGDTRGQTTALYGARVSFDEDSKHVLELTPTGEFAGDLRLAGSPLANTKHATRHAVRLSSAGQVQAELLWSPDLNRLFDAWRSDGWRIAEAAGEGVPLRTVERGTQRYWLYGQPRAAADRRGYCLLLSHLGSK